jgi:signal transduction histidine kinase
MQLDLSEVSPASGTRPLGTADAIARLAHELRAPLATILTAAELLHQDLTHLDAEQVRSMAAMVHRSTRWLQQLVENLHCDTASAQGQMPLRPSPLDPREVLGEIEPLVRPGLAAKTQELAMVASEPLPRVLADRQQIGQVFVNLLANASKFAGRGTRIQVTLTCRGEYLRAAVEDRGPGLPEADLERLFAPYYQAPPPAEVAPHGVGLGLAIVHALVMAHGGRVGAENRRRGGARVWFELPVPPAERVRG